MPAKVAVLGAGSWGTTMAALLGHKCPTALWARRPELAERMAEDRRNPEYVTGVGLPPAVEPTGSIEVALEGADVVIMAVPSHGFRDVLTHGIAHLRAGVPVVSLAKGIEQGSNKRMTEIVADVAPGRPCGVLTGPNLVEEIVAGQPTASVVAVDDAAVADDLQQLFNTDVFRVYTNPDVVGCELAGSLKNVMAIAAGMADGLGFGDNTRAALITRGLAELTRLGVALGGQPMTFAGLAGMGDLVATCISAKSRNRYVGEQLGRGRSLASITAENRWVAEGVRTCRVVVELGDALDVQTPIACQVAAVLYEDKPAADVVANLMARVMKPELHGMDDRTGWEGAVRERSDRVARASGRQPAARGWGLGAQPPAMDV